MIRPVACACSLLLVGCDDTFISGKQVDGILLPDPDGVTWVETIDNPYLPFPVGARWVYEADTPDGTEHIEVVVQDETRNIEGVQATVVRDTVTVDGEVTEDTYDWYAQDADGNVWYLGEDTCEFEDGACVSREGAWEWGVDGAQPGIVMPAHPKANGRPYYQEYDPGNAEDVGEVVDVGVSVTVPAGTFDDCVRTHDTSTLDTSMDEHKTYAPGVGLVLTEEPDATEELLTYSGL